MVIVWALQIVFSLAFLDYEQSLFFLLSSSSRGIESRNLSFLVSFSPQFPRFRTQEQKQGLFVSYGFSKMAHRSTSPGIRIVYKGVFGKVGSKKQD